MPTRRTALGLVLAAGLPVSARAEEWPQRPVTLVHGFSAGGNADSIARVVAQALSGPLGQQVVVEAKPGAGGNLASEAVAKATPDGYTLALLTGGHAVSAALYRRLRFRPIDDFSFASLVATFPFVIAARTDSAYTNLASLIATAKQEPGKLTFSSVGYGSTQHLAGELFASAAGIKLTHVAYRGGMQPLTDLMSGRIDLMVDTITVTGAAVRAGTILGLGVSSAARWPALPEVPPIAATLPGFEVLSWIGVAAPAGTPSDVMGRLTAVIGQALADPAIRAQLAQLGVEPAPSTGVAARDFIAGEIGRWQGVVAKAGIEQL